MTFEEIMKSITSGLTGDPNHDFLYLHEQSEKYKDTEYGKEILRACGRLMYECIPDDKKHEFNAAFHKDHMGVEAAVEEANFNIYKGNLTTGEKILRDMITHIESYKMFEDDSVSEYHTFSEPMEELLYEYLEHPKKDLHRAAEPYSELYLAYGSCLHGLGKYNEALEALKKALRWNPADVRIIFEYAETYKRLGNLDRFFELNRLAHQYAFRPKDVARCCRNTAYYFVEKEMWPEAVGYLLLSQQYDHENPTAASELYYIQNTAGDLYREPSIKEMEVIAKQYKIPFGASDTIIGISYQLAQKCLAADSYEAAEYYAQITDNLLGIEETHELLENIRAQTPPFKSISLPDSLNDEFNTLHDCLQKLYDKNPVDIDTNTLASCFNRALMIYRQVCDLEELPVLEDYDPDMYPKDSYSFQLCCIMMFLEHAVENHKKYKILKERNPEQLEKEIAEKAFLDLGEDLFVDFEVETMNELIEFSHIGIHESLLRIQEIEKKTSK